MNEEYIFGRNPVLEALRSGRSINKIWIADGAQRGSIGPLMNMAKELKVQVQFAPKKKLDQVAKGEAHQGVVAFVSAYRYAEVEEILARAEQKNEDPFILVLDEIEDPRNLGSMIRTADAAGAHGVIIPRRRAAGLTSIVAKAAAGAIEYIPVARVTNIARTMEQLKKRGIWFVGADPAGERDYREASFDMPIGLVIGNEGKGMSRLVKERCDFIFRLPMAGRVASLNASVAGALFMFEVYRQRHPIQTSG